MPFRTGSRSGRLLALALIASTLSVVAVSSIGALPRAAPSSGIAAQVATPVAPESTPFPGVAAPQPSYDTLRLTDGNALVPYHVWVDWLPSLVTGDTGDAWIFFGAQARTGDGLGSRRLYASRFDPVRAVWTPATAMPGGVAQFGPAAAVDSSGTVHVVYADVAEAGVAGSTLVYSRSTPEGGWTDPTPVGPDPNAGYQMMAAIAVDAADGVHVLWRDQRLASPEDRAAHPANGDLFVSDLVAGEWTAPVKVMSRADAAAVAGWPHLAIDGDRLVAVWSIYGGTTDDDMKSAERIDWASRPVADPAAWSAAATLLERPDDAREIGGRLVDVAADPRGGVVAVYGSYERANNELAVRRLGAGSAAWGEPVVIGTGDYGFLPAAVVRNDGTLFVVFNAGRNRNVEVGGIAVKPDGSLATPVTLTPAEDGLQARPAVAVARDDTPWVVYMHLPPNESAVTELRVLREADLLGGAP